MQMLSTTYHYYSSYNPVTITINKQYIEFVIAIIIVMLEVTLVKAPNRDEFYIDVPAMPEPVKARIKLKSQDVMGTFDSLNSYYRWKYMPLSKNEFRFAISNSIRSNSMPVTPTYNNVETMLNELSSKGLVASADGLFAPNAWIAQSKHDIEYLAVFKKLRVYLVGKGLTFTDLDKSDSADITVRAKNESAYLMIYSKTSRFRNVPIYRNGKTYLVFLNSDRLDEFKRELFSSTAREAEQLKLYISSGSVALVDADNPEEFAAL